MAMQIKFKNDAILRDKAFVDGEWISSPNSETFTVYSPGNEQAIIDVPELSRAETTQVIEAAHRAFQSFKQTTARERSRILRAWYDAVIENVEDLATLITLENGKPLSEARGEAIYAANFLEWFSEEAPRLYGDTIPSTIQGNRVITTREPVGVCGIITPWNFPAAMITRKVGPAIAAGCSVVVKPAGETPLTALALAYLAESAGIPPGVFNVVTTLVNTPDVGQELCNHPLVKKISFTGSTTVGRQLMRQSASTLKKITMELGGNAPLIVFNDAELGRAVDNAILSKFRSSGQTCICANRIYVQSGVYDEFVVALEDKVKAFCLGNGFEPATTHGPLINVKAVDKVEEHVQDAQRLGARVIFGGERRHDLGKNYFAPTVLRDVPTGAALHREETFGPVAGIFKFLDEEDVLRMANSTDTGLAAYIFSQDVSRCWRVGEALEVGMVGINTGMISDAASPFGGVNQSGFGREGSKYGIDEYTFVKTLTFGCI